MDQTEELHVGPLIFKRRTLNAGRHVVWELRCMLDMLTICITNGFHWHPDPPGSWHCSIDSNNLHQNTNTRQTRAKATLEEAARDLIELMHKEFPFWVLPAPQHVQIFHVKLPKAPDE